VWKLPLGFTISIENSESNGVFSALWSIAYKNVALKASAGKCGAFILLCSAARMHRSKPHVLPHIFIALANLCANHAPNQIEAGRSEVITICVEFLSGCVLWMLIAQ
jgi:hypothetical protein